MEQGIEGDILSTNVKDIGFQVVSFIPNGRIMGLLTNGIQSGDESRDVVLVCSGGRL